MLEEVYARRGKPGDINAKLEAVAVDSSSRSTQSGSAKLLNGSGADESSGSTGAASPRRQTPRHE